MATTTTETATRPEDIKTLNFTSALNAEEQLMTAENPPAIALTAGIRMEGYPEVAITRYKFIHMYLSGLLVIDEIIDFNGEDRLRRWILPPGSYQALCEAGTRPMDTAYGL